MLRDLAADDRDVHRARRDRARAGDEDVALEAERPGRRLARLRPHLRRGRPHPAQGPHADPGRVLRLRRRPQPARLRDEPDVLADAPAPHRARPRAPRPDRARIAGQARAGGQPPLRILRRRTSPGPPSSTPSEGPPDMPKTPTKAAAAARPARAKATSKADRTYDAIVIGGGHNGLTNGVLPGQGRPADAGPGAAAPRRRRRDHRGAAARLLVHDVLVRAEPAPAGHHPGPRPGQARLHADPDADHVLPEGGRRLPAARPGPRREPQGDRPPQPARRRRVRRVQPRRQQGAARRSSRCSTWSRRTSSATTPRSWWPWRRSARGSAGSTRRCCTTRSAC